MFDLHAKAPGSLGSRREMPLGGRQQPGNFLEQANTVFVESHGTPSGLSSRRRRLLTARAWIATED